MPDPSPHTWELVPLRPEDLPQVAAIEEAVFPEPLSLEAVRSLYSDPATTYVAFRDGDVVAAYFGFQVTGPTAHVIANATHPAYRRRQLGRRILTRAEPVARLAGARWFLGEVRVSNTPQRLLLAGLGWVDIGLCPHFFGNGEDARVVWRVLSDPAGGESL